MFSYKNSRYYRSPHTSKTWLLPWNKLTGYFLMFALLVFGLITWVAFVQEDSFDYQVLATIRPHITASGIQTMRIISFLSKHSFLIPAYLLLLVFFLLIRNYKGAVTVFIVAITSMAFFTLLKRLVGRIRPEDQLVEGITNFSFPSGHAFMSVAFYGLFIFWAALIIKQKWPRRFVITVLMVIIILIGFSRIYLRVHYATDVIAGWSLGTSWLLVSLHLVTRVLDKYFPTKELI